MRTNSEHEVAAVEHRTELQLAVHSEQKKAQEELGAWHLRARKAEEMAATEKRRATAAEAKLEAAIEASSERYEL